MQKVISLLTIATLIAVNLACQPQPERETPAESPSESGRSADDQEIIKEEKEKVNDRNDLPDTEDGNECPPPREHDDICAQVITYGLSADGVCCEYATPCDVPEDLESFSSKDECQQAARE